MELVEQFGIEDPIERGHIIRDIYEEALEYGLHDMRTLRVMICERIRAEIGESLTELGLDL